MSEQEPIFARQEQGVVYLFSRYWKKIPEFKNKWLYDIQMRFPDASMVDTETGANEAIEFEYALSSFDHYKAADSKKLERYKSLYIVYWDQDRDEGKIRAWIAPHFKGNVMFVCLSQYFMPSIEREADRLGAYWEFCPNRQAKGVKVVYPLKKIEEDTKALADQEVIEPLVVRQPRESEEAA